MICVPCKNLPVQIQLYETLEKIVEYIQNIIKTLEQNQWRHSSVFIVNCGYILHLSLVFPWLNLNR